MQKKQKRRRNENENKEENKKNENKEENKEDEKKKNENKKKRAEKIAMMKKKINEKKIATATAKATATKIDDTNSSRDTNEAIRLFIRYSKKIQVDYLREHARYDGKGGPLQIIKMPQYGILNPFDTSMSQIHTRWTKFTTTTSHSSLDVALLIPVESGIDVLLVAKNGIAAFQEVPFDIQKVVVLFT